MLFAFLYFGEQVEHAGVDVVMVLEGLKENYRRKNFKGNSRLRRIFLTKNPTKKIKIIRKFFSSRKFRKWSWTLSYAWPTSKRLKTSPEVSPTLKSIRKSTRVAASSGKRSS